MNPIPVRELRRECRHIVGGRCGDMTHPNEPNSREGIKTDGRKSHVRSDMRYPNEPNSREGIKTTQARARLVPL